MAFSEITPIKSLKLKISKDLRFECFGVILLFWCISLSLKSIIIFNVKKQFLKREDVCIMNLCFMIGNLCLNRCLFLCYKLNWKDYYIIILHLHQSMNFISNLSFNIKQSIIAGEVISQGYFNIQFVWAFESQRQIKFWRFIFLTCFKL